ncbi:IucA/IucC family protein [Thalassospira lucentensis]|uniref:IucA/IucC family protein n=1 Tax=Thalassospira lucentensis TaxID=168935 RepID=UPI0003B42E35|nr:IucA/IucC family protein [Thalassospira lucentensis]RCK27806.1 hypothetical protein TH1_11165 [Thalassospira lucentensis MCCC 1A00383 = DSM 14000]
MNAIDDKLAKADRLICQDLFEGLHAEEYFENQKSDLIAFSDLPETQETSELLQYLGLDRGLSSGMLWRWTTSDDRFVYAAVEKAVLYPFQLMRNSRLVGKSADGFYHLECLSFLDLVCRKLIDESPDSREGIAVFTDMVKTSIEQMALSLSYQIDTNRLLSKTPQDFFQIMEQWASLRDRPYHPVAKAKMGLSNEEYTEFMAEFDKDISLVWIAIKADSLMLGEGVENSRSKSIADALLTPDCNIALQKEMEKKGLSQSHIALPVHPWQLDHYIRPHYDQELQDGTCHILDFQGYRVKATSSLRSMAPLSPNRNYLKLPMHIFSLAASRYLPAVKMINGNLSEALLRKGLQLDPALESRVFVCDETSWWAYFTEGTSLFDERPRHLSAMVRTYPEILEDDQYRLIPMAALGTPLPGSRVHFFDEWLNYRDMARTENNILTLFREVCETFFDINFRMFKIGMLAEIHGQNAVMVWKDGQAHGLLLRDHDSLRIFVPWLERNGLSDPEYRIKKGYANTLYHDRPEDLLFYLQTLGIQVNLRAIAETLANIYDIEASEFWKQMKGAIIHALDNASFNKEDRTMIAEHLFDTPYWPYKQLVRPIIARAGGPGSMPWGKGKVQNPFQNIDP